MSRLKQNPILSNLQRILVIDSHTAGEPTRVVVSGGPLLPNGTMDERKSAFARRFDSLRSIIVCEPRGSDILVGALLTPPEHSSSLCGVIYFNNVGYLGMCGHGTIGVAATLEYLSLQGETQWLGGLQQLPMQFVIDTAVGSVPVRQESQRTFTIQNVVSYRFRKSVAIQVRGRTVHGDIAWGGNWFFLCEDHGLELDQSQVGVLQEFAQSLRSALRENSIVGAHDAEIDHIELFSKPSDPLQFDSRNFVLCPGGAYDRSPCGTGTSAKLACLAADGKLAPDEPWRQESIIGSKFEARYQPAPNGGIVPFITGSAYITSQAELIIDSEDPLRRAADEFLPS